MQINSQHCYQTALEHREPQPGTVYAAATNQENQGIERTKIEILNCSQAVIESQKAVEILEQLKSGKLLMVDQKRRNGLILYKRFYAEFAGPGAAIGGNCDLDCTRVVPVGNLSLIEPETPEDRTKAYLIRRQWIKLTQDLTDDPVPARRVQRVLNQFENYFDADTIAQVPDEAFSLLVGVLPQTVSWVRRTPERLHTRVKS